MHFNNPLNRVSVALVLIHVAMLTFVIVAMVATLPTQAMPM